MTGETDAGKGLNLAPLLNGAMASGSPKGMYVFFLLSAANMFLEEMRMSDKSGGSDRSVSNSALGLIAFLPEKNKRKTLFQLLVDLDKKSPAAMQWAEKEYGYYPKTQSAVAALVVGELVDYLSETLELVEVESGGMV
jgi:hypothetical protein